MPSWLSVVKVETCGCDDERSSYYRVGTATRDYAYEGNGTRRTRRKAVSGNRSTCAMEAPGSELVSVCGACVCLSGDLYGVCFAISPIPNLNNFVNVHHGLVQTKCLGWNEEGVSEPWRGKRIWEGGGIGDWRRVKNREEEERTIDGSSMDRRDDCEDEYEKEEDKEDDEEEIGTRRGGDVDDEEKDSRMTRLGIAGVSLVLLAAAVRRKRRRRRPRGRLMTVIEAAWIAGRRRRRRHREVQLIMEAVARRRARGGGTAVTLVHMRSKLVPTCYGKIQTERPVTGAPWAPYLG